jgi:acyl-coenzyme A synthetase/AMP-(fatty) acid ligase
MGYWNDPEKTKERFRPNPLQSSELQIPEIVVYSGDYVQQDEEGYIYFVGRKDNMIKTSGFRVSPTEIEESFHNTGKVQDVVALGIPDEEKGESIKVIAVLRPNANITCEALLWLVSEDLSSYMIPKELELREVLPKNPNGKIDRVAIQREELSKRQ